MGVIDIRMRQERLGNLGAVQAVDVRNGAAEAWGAVGRAGEKVADGIVSGLKGLGNIVAVAQQKEDKRQIDGAIAEGTKALNQMMYNVGTDGSPHGFMVDANDVTKGGSVVPNFEANYETMLSDLKKNRKLTDSQFKLVKNSLGQRAEGWRTQLVGRIGETYARSEEQNAAVKAQADFDTLVDKPVLDDADWNTLSTDLVDPSYVRGHRLLGDNAIKANAQNVILQADKQRKDAWIKSAMAGTETFTTEEQVKNYFAIKRKELEKHKFITDGMIGTLTKEQRSKAAEAFEDTLKKAETSAVALAKARFTEQIESARDKFYASEPELTEGATPELRAIALRNAAQPFKDRDPRFYNVIMGKAELQDMKAEQIQAQKQVQELKAQTAAEKKKREDDRHDVLKMATFYLVQPKNLTDQERKDWLRKRREFEVEYWEMFKRDEIDPELVKTVDSMMSTHYSKEKEQAINGFDAKFGFDRGAFATSADVGRELRVRKEADGTDTHVSVRLGDKEATITYEQLQKYRNRFLLELDKAPKGTDMVDWADRCADRIISEAVKDHAPELITKSIGRMGAWSRAAESKRMDEARANVNALYSRKAYRAGVEELDRRINSFLAPETTPTLDIDDED